MPKARIPFGRQKARVEPVLRLVVDPVLIPFLLPVLPLERLQPLVPEKIGEKPNGRVLKVFRRPGRRRRGVETQGIEGIAGNGNRSRAKYGPRRKRPALAHPTKKPTRSNTLKVFDRVGLLVNGPPGPAGLPFN